MMQGTISIKDLEISCIIGIHPHERHIPQNIFIDIEFDSDFELVSQSGQLSNSIDYDSIASFLTSWIQEKKFGLLEQLAEKACLKIFEKWPEINCCRIKVKKPNALIHAKYASVSITRCK